MLVEDGLPATFTRPGPSRGDDGAGAAGEPLQYVLGSWQFRGLDLMVDRGSSSRVPRPRSWCRSRSTRWSAGWASGSVGPIRGPVALTEYAVADLGTGSGRARARARALALPDAAVWATDVSEAALAVARANVAGAGTPAARIRIGAGSWYEALPPARRGSLLLIVSNPPYIGAEEVLPPVVADWEPAGALVAGPTGFEAIEQLVAEAPTWLDPAGTLVVELAPHQAEAAVRLARAAGFAQVRTRPDLTGRPRVLVARRRADT